MSGLKKTVEILPVKLTGQPRFSLVFDRSLCTHIVFENQNDQIIRFPSQLLTRIVSVFVSTALLGKLSCGNVNQIQLNLGVDR